MDNIADILSRKDFDQPAEIGIIKRYVAEHFNVSVGVSIGPNTITINARSAALVNTLRMHTLQLQQVCQTDKRIIFRIG